MFLTALASSAIAQQQKDDTPPAADETAAEPLERFLEQLDTLTADFELRAFTPSGGLIEHSKGTMAVDRPGRFRWHYAPPDELLLVADGESLKMYEFDLEQLTISPLESAAADPLSLLSGDGDFRDAFDVVGRYSADGLDWIKLEPIAATAEFTSVAIGFGGDALQRIDLVDATDSLTRIDLSNLVVNAALPPDLFEFEAPEGATILGGK